MGAVDAGVGRLNGWWLGTERRVYLCICALWDDWSSAVGHAMSVLFNAIRRVMGWCAALCSALCCVLAVRRHLRGNGMGHLLRSGPGCSNGTRWPMLTAVAWESAALSNTPRGELCSGVGCALRRVWQFGAAQVGTLLD